LEEFWQQVVTGIATGSVYGLLALAVVLIYRSTGVLNFAQGEMAMLTTFVAWSILQWGEYGRWRGRLSSTSSSSPWDCSPS
jgi:branched-chain amino acid transport system permease protein